MTFAISEICNEMFFAFKSMMGIYANFHGSSWKAVGKGRRVPQVRRSFSGRGRVNDTAAFQLCAW